MAGRFFGSTILRRIVAATVAATLLTAGATQPVGAAAGSSWLPGQAEFASLAQDRRVHYEPGAENYARAIAAALPAAIATVEAAQGRPFREPIVVVVYATNEAYQSENGTGSYVPLGTTFMHRIMLAPRLWSYPELSRTSLRLILTHELSHLHFEGHRGLFAYAHLPSWFLEGIAVMVSGGGGAQRVSPEAARAAIAAGRTIRIIDRTALFGSNFDDPQPRSIADGDEQYYYHMYYRQAALFVAYLRDKDPVGFARFLNNLLDGKEFGLSFQNSLGSSPTKAWREFVTVTKGEAHA